MLNNNTLTNFAHRNIGVWGVIVLMIPLITFIVFCALYVFGSSNFLSVTELYSSAIVFGAITLVAYSFVQGGGKRVARDKELISKINGLSVARFNLIVFGGAACAAVKKQCCCAVFAIKSNLITNYKLAGLVLSILGTVSENLAPRLLPVPFAASA